MKIKQTLKYITGIVGIVALFVIPNVASAASCGGVQTEIISCGQTGACPTPTDGRVYYPNEGSDPGTDSKKVDAYQAAYGHKYGFCKDGSTPNKTTTQNGIWGLLVLGINILSAGVGIAAVGGIVYGSILYTSAGGNADQTKKAIEFIRNVIIGVVAYALMFAFLNFIIPGGLFG